MKTQVIIGLVCLLCCVARIYGQVTVQNGIDAPDVPGFTPNLKTIPAGSLIIPMDPFLQVTVPKTTGLMSLLPYGLVIRTLYANVSLYWAINTGKPLSGPDFSATCSNATFASVANSGLSAFSGSGTSFTYYGGPLIIPQQNVAKALAAWASWKSNPGAEFITVQSNVYDTVQIHLLQSSVLVDVRHTLSSRPFVAVSNLDGNAPTQTAMLGCIYQNATRACPREDGSGWGDIFGSGAAGCTAFSPVDHAGLDWNVHYATYDCGTQVAALTDTTCLATFSEPHWDWISSTGPQYISAMIKFVNSGANFIAQCASTESYENSATGVSNTGTFLTPYGLEALNPDNGINCESYNQLNTVTNYPDLPVCQYVGAMSSAITGAVPDWYNLFGGANDDTAPQGWQTPAAGSYQSTSAAYNDFNSNSFPLVTNVYDTTGATRGNYNLKGRNTYVAAGAKLNQAKVLGSNIFYLGGHTWAGTTTAGTDNGRRFFLNAVLVPADRPLSCGFNFCTPGQQGSNVDYCTPTYCDPSGTTYVPSPTAGCCTVNANCTSPCTSCNLNTHTCQLIPGCCAPGYVNCSTACTSCQDVSAGVGQCLGSSGCCTNDTQCQGSTPSACIHCVSNACVRTPAPTCCDTPSQCTSTCYTCESNACVRQTPSSCCLQDADCNAPGQVCSACNLATNQCYQKPGCCNTYADCATTSHCVECSNNTCIRKQSCCDCDAQCGACLQCSTTNYTCVASSDKSCCTQDSQCPTCSNCAQGSDGASTCLPIPNCCLTSSDCEICEICTTGNVCQRLPTSGNDSCCRFDADCTGCDVCTSYQCTPNYDLSCCETNDDCTTARTLLLNNNNITHSNISGCDLQCVLNVGGSGTGQCQAVCTSPKSYTGLIVGLAVGIPVGLAALAALGLIVGIILYRKRDALTAKFVAKSNDMGAPSHSNPIHEQAITVHHAPAGL